MTKHFRKKKKEEPAERQAHVSRKPNAAGRQKTEKEIQ